MPDRANIKDTSPADPLKFYYLPLARSFYIARFADSIRLLGGNVNSLLDNGCGSGIFLPELSKHCDNLFACDFHPRLNVVLDMLKKESVNAGVVRTDARALPYATESMNAIVSMSVLEHLDNLETVVSEFYRVLRPGGVAIVGVPVSNLVTETILRLSFLSLDANLEDEHISTHRDVFNRFSEKFIKEKMLNIPRLLPEALRMYSTVRFRKP